MKMYVFIITSTLVIGGCYRIPTPEHATKINSSTLKKAPHPISGKILEANTYNIQQLNLSEDQAKQIARDFLADKSPIPGKAARLVKMEEIAQKYKISYPLGTKGDDDVYVVTFDGYHGIMREQHRSSSMIRPYKHMDVVVRKTDGQVIFAVAY